MIILLSILLYILMGVVKLRFFDLNGDGDWLLMWSDPHSRRCSAFWLYIGLILCWLTWPGFLVSRDFSLAELLFKIQWNFGRKD